MNARQILNDLRGIKAQAMSSIASNQLVLENATKLERRIEKELGHVDGPAPHKGPSRMDMELAHVLKKRQTHFKRRSDQSRG